MAYDDQAYDFWCGNDLKTLRLAVKNPNTYAVNIDAPFVRHLDLSQGIFNVEEIMISHAAKLSRIKWPKDTSSISRLVLAYADVLEVLDLSALTNLDELIIYDCRNLTEIKGIQAKIRVIKIEESPVKTLSLKKFEYLKNPEYLPIQPEDLAFEPHATDVETLVQKQGYGMTGRENPLVKIGLLGRVDQNYDYLFQSDTLAPEYKSGLVESRQSSKKIKAPAWIVEEDKSRKELKDFINDKSYKFILLNSTLPVATSLSSLDHAVIYEGKNSEEALKKLSKPNILIIPSVAMAKKLLNKPIMKLADKVVILGRKRILDYLLVDKVTPVITMLFSGPQILRTIFEPTMRDSNVPKEVSDQIINSSIARATRAYENQRGSSRLVDIWRVANVLAESTSLNPSSAAQKHPPHSYDRRPTRDDVPPARTDKYQKLPETDQKPPAGNQQYDMRPRRGETDSYQKSPDEYGNLPTRDENDNTGEYGDGDQYGNLGLNDDEELARTASDKYGKLSINDDEEEEEELRRPGKDDYGVLPTKDESDSSGEYGNPYDELPLDNDEGEELRRPINEDDEELERKKSLNEAGIIHAESRKLNEKGIIDANNEHLMNRDNLDAKAYPLKNVGKVDVSVNKLSEHGSIDIKVASEQSDPKDLPPVSTLVAKSSFFSAKASPKVVKKDNRDILDAAKAVADNIEKLMQAVNVAFESQLIGNLDKKEAASYKKEVSASFSVSANVLLERASLVDQLKSIRDALENELQEERAMREKSAKQGGTFSQASNIGKKNARLMVLESVIRNLMSGEPISEQDAKAKLADILKEKQVSSSLGKDQIEQIKSHLTHSQFSLKK